MGVALQAFMLLLVYLPGGIFVFVLTGEASRNKELPTISAAGLTGWTVLAFLIAMLLHGLAATTISLAADLADLPFASSAQAFVRLLLAVPQNADYVALRDRFADNLGCFAVSELTVCVVAFCLGSLAWCIIDRGGLDRRYSWLRFHPHWHYILSGKNSDVENLDDLAIRVYAVVELDKKAMVYSGLLSSYWFDEKTGALDVIVLDAATRQALPDVSAKKRPDTLVDLMFEYVRGRLLSSSSAADSTPEAEEVALGDNLTIQYSEIKNLNIQYVVVPDESE